MKTFRYKIWETNIGYIDIEAESEDEADAVFDDNFMDYSDNALTLHEFGNVERDWEFLGEVKE